MNKIKYFLLITLTLISIGCAVQRQSKFTTVPIKIGMTKDAVIALYGRPYKESLSIDKSQNVLETLFYKEHMFLGRWYEVNSILYLENSVLKSLEQGKEQLLYKNRQVIDR